MPAFFRQILIFITGYAWVLALGGPALMAFSAYSQWKADGDHAYTQRDKLQAVAGVVSEASEVTVTGKRGRTTKKYYEISVKPEAGGDVRKLRIDHSTPEQVVGDMIDEKVNALVDTSDNDLVYDLSVNGTSAISYDETRDRMIKSAADQASSMGGAGIWVLAIGMLIVGAGGVWFNRKLKAAHAASATA